MTKPKAKPVPSEARALEVTWLGSVPLVAPLYEAQPLSLRTRIAKAEAMAAGGDVEGCRKAVLAIEDGLGVTMAERIAAGRPAGEIEAALETALHLALGTATLPDPKARTPKVMRPKRGRRTSGLRDLSPDAARRALTDAAARAVREATALGEEFVKKTGMAGGKPTMERLIRGDLQMSTALVPIEGELLGWERRPVLMAKSLLDRLREAGLSDRLAWVAMKFVEDIEQLRLGRMTASYGDAGGGFADMNTRMAKMAKRLGDLKRASEMMTAKENATLWGVLVFGLSLTDIGWAVAGERFGTRREPLINAASIFLEGALERVAAFYEARGD